MNLEPFKVNASIYLSLRYTRVLLNLNNPQSRQSNDNWINQSRQTNENIISYQEQSFLSDEFRGGTV